MDVFLFYNVINVNILSEFEKDSESMQFLLLSFKLLLVKKNLSRRQIIMDNKIFPNRVLVNYFLFRMTLGIECKWQNFAG